MYYINNNNNTIITFYKQTKKIKNAWNNKPNFSRKRLSQNEGNKRKKLVDQLSN